MQNSLEIRSQSSFHRYVKSMSNPAYQHGLTHATLSNEKPTQNSNMSQLTPKSHIYVDCTDIKAHHCNCYFRWKRCIRHASYISCSRLSKTIPNYGCQSWSPYCGCRIEFWTPRKIQLTDIQDPSVRFTPGLGHPPLARPRTQRNTQILSPTCKCMLFYRPCLPGTTLTQSASHIRLDCECEILLLTGVQGFIGDGQSSASKPTRSLSNNISLSKETSESTTPDKLVDRQNPPGRAPSPSINPIKPPIEVSRWPQKELAIQDNSSKSTPSRSPGIESTVANAQQKRDGCFRLQTSADVGTTSPQNLNDELRCTTRYAVKVMPAPLAEQQIGSRRPPSAMVSAHETFSEKAISGESIGSSGEFNPARRLEGNRVVSDSTLDVKDSHEERLDDDPRSTIAKFDADIATPSTEQQASLSSSLTALVPAQTSCPKSQTSTTSNRFENAQRQYFPERQPDQYPWLSRYRRRVANSQIPSHTVPADLCARKPIPATEHHHLRQNTYNNGVGEHASQADKTSVRPRASLEESKRVSESKNQSNERNPETPTSRQSMFDMEARAGFSQSNTSNETPRSWPKRRELSPGSKNNSNGEISETSTSRQSTPDIEMEVHSSQSNGSHVISRARKRGRSSESKGNSHDVISETSTSRQSRSDNETEVDFSQVDTSYGSNNGSYWGVSETPPSKRGHGRPPGSQNKPKDLTPPPKRPKGQPTGFGNKPKLYIFSSLSGSKKIFSPPSHSYSAPSHWHSASRQFRSIGNGTETPSKTNTVSLAHDRGNQWVSVNPRPETRSQPSTTATQSGPIIKTGRNACRSQSLSPSVSDPNPNSGTGSADIGARDRTKIQSPPVSSMSTLLAATAFDKAQMVHPESSHGAAGLFGEEEREATCSLQESTLSPSHASYATTRLRDRDVFHGKAT